MLPKVFSFYLIFQQLYWDINILIKLHILLKINIISGLYIVVFIAWFLSALPSNVDRKVFRSLTRLVNLLFLHAILVIFNSCVFKALKHLKLLRYLVELIPLSLWNGLCLSSLVIICSDVNCFLLMYTVQQSFCCDVKYIFLALYCLSVPLP